MANYFQAAQKFLPILDEVYAKQLITSVLEVNQNTIEFKGVDTVKLYVTLTDGLGDYVRANHAASASDAGRSDYNGNNYSGARDGFPIGGTTGFWEEHKLAYLRGTQFKIDRCDDEESFGMALGSTLSQFVRTQVIKEIDEVRFAKLAAACSSTAGNLVSATISANQIVAKINDALEYIENVQADAEQYVLFVSTNVMKLIRNTTELTRYITVEDFVSERGITFKLQRYNGMPIIEVPNSRFYTAPVLDAHNGIHPGASSYLINFLLVPLSAAIPVIKQDTLKVYGEDVVTEFNGYKVNYLIWHDIIIPEQKKVGIYCHVSETAAGSYVNVLAPILEAGSTSGATAYKGFNTKPAGLNGKVCYSASTAFAVGTTYTVDGSTNIGLAAGDEFTLGSTVTACKFALLDGAGRAVAVSGSITVPKKS